MVPGTETSSCRKIGSQLINSFRIPILNFILIFSSRDSIQWAFLFWTFSLILSNQVCILLHYRRNFNMFFNYIQNCANFWFSSLWANGDFCYPALKFLWIVVDEVNRWWIARWKMKRLIKLTRIKTFKLSLLNIIHLNVINTKSKEKESYVKHQLNNYWLSYVCNYLRIKRAFDVACRNEAFFHRTTDSDSTNTRPTVTLVELNHMQLFTFCHWDASFTCRC